VWQRSAGCIVILALALLGISTGVVAQPSGKSHRIGWLGSGTQPSAPDPSISDFQQGLRDLGYVEGKNLVVDYRYASSNGATELASLPVELIVTSGEPAALAGKRGPKTFPIVVTELGVDPVTAGLVASLGRPGGNVTGVASFGTEELWQKRLQFLKQLAPKSSRLAVLWNPAQLGNTNCVQQIKAAAPALAMQLSDVPVRDANALEQAFATLAKAPPDALVTCWDTLTLGHAKAIADFALKLRLPMLAPLREYVQAGGLISYGPNLPAQRRRAAYYVDKILKGAKPADLPVEQSANLELVINLSTAKALALRVPENFMLLADELIQ